MLLKHLLLTCCLLVSATLVIAQDDASAAIISTIPSGVIGGGFIHAHDDNSIKINKEIEIEAKDIIVNIGKVDIEIEREKQKRRSDLELASFEDAEDAEDDHHMKHDDDGNKIKINKEIEIEAKDIIVNIGKVKVEIEKDEHEQHTTKKPTWKPTHKPTWKPTWKPTHKPHVSDDATDPTTVEELPLFEDFTPAAEPDLTEEVVLGENATAAAITVQGGEQFDEQGVLILTGPQIFSVTFKIIKEKIVTIRGSNFKDDGFGINGIEDGIEDGLVDGFDDGFKNRKRREAVTFIIRGRGFVPGREFFTDIEDVVGGTSRGGMFEFLEPRVFLGAIPLKVVRFTDTVILARFLDFEDQRRFEAGTLLARVKVLHVDIRRKKEKKHGPEEDFGILGGPGEKEQRNEIVSVGGLVLPALGAIGGSITSGPVLGVVDGIGIDGREHEHGEKENRGFESSLLGLFSGLRFDTAVLAVQFSEKDAQKIRGSVSTLFTDDFGLGFPDI